MNSASYTELYGILPRKLKFGYGVGHVFNDICASMWFTYLLVFFHLVLEFSHWEAGLLLLVGQIADALSTPFVGYCSDRFKCETRCFSLGKRKAWYFLGTLCVTLAFPFIFSGCGTCVSTYRVSQMVYYSVFIIIFQFGWASVQISHLALIPELTPNEDDRTRLVAIRYGFTVFSNMFIYIITAIVLHIGNGAVNQLGPADAPKFQEIMIIGMVVGLVFSLIFCILVKEDRFGAMMRGSEYRVSVRDLLSNVQLYKVAVVYMSTRLYVNLNQIFVPLYLHEVLQLSANSLALVPLTMFIGSLLMSFKTDSINRFFGRKMTYLLGVAFGILGAIWIRFGIGRIYSVYEVYIVALVIGVTDSILLVTSLGITADFIDDKTESGAMVYGLMSFTDKLANGVAVIIIENLHHIGPVDYYKYILSYVCGIVALAGGLTTLLVKKRTREAQSVPDENTPLTSSINS